MTAAPSIAPPAGRVPAAGATTILADAAGIDLNRLPGCDLEPHELRALASAIALDPTGWSEHVAFADGQRHYVNLYRDNYVDVWLLCWTPDNDTGWHDHDLSSGAVAVVQGELVEHNLALGHDSVADGRSGRPGLRLRARPHPPAHRPSRRQRQHPCVLASAVADGPVRHQLRRRPAASLGLLRGRAATAGRTRLTSGVPAGLSRTGSPRGTGGCARGHGIVVDRVRPMPTSCRAPPRRRMMPTRPPTLGGHMCRLRAEGHAAQPRRPTFAHRRHSANESESALRRGTAAIFRSHSPTRMMIRLRECERAAREDDCGRIQDRAVRTTAVAMSPRS